MKTRSCARRAGGFTFVELLVCLAILAVLALVSVPMAQVAAQRHKEQELRQALMEIRSALDAYKRAAEQGRIALKVGDTGYPRSLQVLVDGVDDQRSPVKKKIYFLRRLPRDPFAAEDLQAQDSWALRSFASPADDPRAGDDVYDVFSKSERKGLNGVPYRLW
ncbi:type II secretion system protein [Pelomonas sp. BJYL3]|uniref:type II secretion system protein n=1 Tax=Pelomonas sp. BJYL3 TaxID=2976697 RepID=UPI0022B4973D|nr:type II secretion system protein [Pelomonas sp. BJYL3]